MMEEENGLSKQNFEGVVSSTELVSGKIREKEREREGERTCKRATITCALFFTLCESINI